jgi:beta-glucosidase
MTRDLRVAVAGALSLCFATFGCADEAKTSKDSLAAYCRVDSAEVEARIDALLPTLTLEEKASLMHGASVLTIDGTWQSTAIGEKGIPGFHMLDGPKGVGGSSTVPIANGALTTAFPAAIARSATWNRELETRVGQAIGREVRAVGADTLLAPGMNLAWHPLSGRNQDYYGEDPFLAGEIGVAFVKGVQSMGVIATAKHFTANHVEETRLDMNANVDERTLRENFLPQFRKVVQEANVGAVMSAYNQLNGTYCGENKSLLTDILREEWAFAGFVMSDFFWGTHNTVPSALAGLDVEMQFSQIYGQPVVDAVNNQELDEANVDEHVRRILRAQFCFELDSNPPVPDDAKLETEETIALAREVAAKSIVLLRNASEFLPLSKIDARSIVLVGPLADIENIGDSNGSSGVRSSEVVTIAEGLLARTDVASTIEFVPGDLADVGDQAKVSAADVVVVAVGLSDQDEGEGQVRSPAPKLGAGDRETYGLPADHLALLTDVLALANNVVVVVEGGSAIDMTPWAENVSAVLMAWYPGVQGGHAVADVLFGDENPSGRLPVTIPASLEDLQAFPGLELDVTYERYHGYQRLDKNSVAPYWPFGFGLSFTTFSYDDVSVDDATVRADDEITLSISVSNTGSRSGVETVQVYAGAVAPTVDRPIRKLVGFAQALLNAGETKTVDVSVPVGELAYYHEETGWVVDPGSYRFKVGGNAFELPLFVDVRVR